jgi:hypothetical protein
MIAFLAEVWEFLTARSDHPIYRREMAGWSYLSLWRKLRRGCLPLVALIIVITTGCCGGSAYLSMTPSITPDDWPLVAISLLFGMLLGGETVRWLVGLLATAVTSTVISAEVEADTFSLLRLTPVTTRQIVLAKFGAAFRQFRLPLALVAIVRLAFVIGGIALVIALIVTSIPSAATPGVVTPAPAAPLPGPGAGTILGWGIAGAAVLVAALLWLAYFLISPFISTTIFAAVGLLGSAWARSRAGGLTAAIGFRMGLWAASYVAGQIITVAITLISVPLSVIPAAPGWLDQAVTQEPSALVAAAAVMAVLWLAISAVGQIGVTLLLLYAAARRAERLPFA